MSDPEKKDIFLEIDYKGEKKGLTEEEAKEIAQKGFDYHQKTEALAKER